MQKRGTETEYNNVAGDYRSISMVEGYNQRRLIQISSDELITLSEKEVFLRDHIERLIEERQGSVPVVCWDDGGAISKTWLRLAKSFEREVEAGSILFVSSNLLFKPEDFCEQKGMAPENVNFLSQNKDLVRFINSARY